MRETPQNSEAKPHRIRKSMGSTRETPQNSQIPFSTTAPVAGPPFCSEGSEPTTDPTVPAIGGSRVYPCLSLTRLFFLVVLQKFPCLTSCHPAKLGGRFGDGLGTILGRFGEDSGTTSGRFWVDVGFGEDPRGSWTGCWVQFANRRAMSKFGFGSGSVPDRFWEPSWAPKTESR